MTQPLPKPQISRSLICVLCGYMLESILIPRTGFVHKHPEQCQGKIEQCSLTGKKYIVDEDGKVQEYFDHDL